MNIADVLSPEYVTVAREMMARKRDDRAPTVYELEIVTKGNRCVRLEVSTRLIYNDGKPVGVQGVGRDLTERKRSEEALAQQSQREAMTHRMSQAIRCSLDTSEIFRTAVHELGLHLNADRCSLFMKDEKNNCAENVAEYHADGIIPAATTFELEDVRVLIESLDKDGIVCFNDAASDPRIADVYERILSRASVRSIMYVAIRVGDEVTAAFALSTTRQLRNWSPSDIALAKAVADQTGIAIRQAELYQKAEATSKREVLVNRLTMAIRASLSLADVLSTATRELGVALEASRVHLHLYDPENPISPVEHEYVGPGCDSIGSFHISYEDAIGRHLLGISKPLVIDDALNHDGGPADFSAAVREHARTAHIQSQIDYPLVVKGRFRGMLCIHQTDRLRRWSDDELSLVHSVAERLAIGMGQAELFEMVARAKSEWETTFDAMSDGIFIFDSAGHLRRVNRAGAAMEASHPRALLGRKCCDVLRTSTQDSTCVVEKALQEGHSVTIEVTPDRLNRPILVSIEPVLNKAGAVTAAVCTARDLSELRKVQAVAREHQFLLTNILESARESIYAVDMDGRFKWCNSATLAALGLRREAFIGRHLLELVYDADRVTIGEKLQMALKGEAQTYEMRYFSADGRLRYARVDNSPLVVEGRTTGVLGIARDITEQKEERERAARADKLRALGQLASGVAHDFNNSLAAILGRAQLLRRQIRDDALVRNLEIIQTAAEDAAATVRRIQTFARKSPAKEFEILDVTALLNDAIEITRTRWENEARLRGLNYEVRLDAESGQYTSGSASELREVFVNLIVNAVDAMPEGGKLTLSSIPKGGRLRLRFADTGTGMPEDVRQKIFDPFFSTKGAHGTGLGLSVSYSIIERHDGSISVASEVNGGTVFTIDLPAAEVKSESVDTKPENLETPSLCILVIDDEPAVRETLAEMLEIMGHRVMLAESGHNALQTLAVNSCDLVFTDLAMPEMDGWETSRAIRKRWSDMKVVLVTGYGTGTVPPAGEEDLVNGIIGKPFDFAQINQTISSIVAKDGMLESVRV
jgi:PAS domain S-box-containing protein